MEPPAPRDGTYRAAQAQRGGVSLRAPEDALSPPDPLGGPGPGWGRGGGGSHPPPEKLRADTRTLTRTLSARIQHLQLFPPGLRIHGLDSMLGGGPGGGSGLGALSQRLQLFQLLLSRLPWAPPGLSQINNDLENLRSLLAAMEAQAGCDPPREAPPGLPQALPEALAQAPHTAAGLALARLSLCLDRIARSLDGPPGC